MKSNSEICNVSTFINISDVIQTQRQIAHESLPWVAGRIWLRKGSGAKKPVWGRRPSVPSRKQTSCAVQPNPNSAAVLNILSRGPCLGWVALMNSTWMLCKSKMEDWFEAVPVVTAALAEWALIWSLSDHPTKAQWETLSDCHFSTQRLSAECHLNKLSKEPCLFLLRTKKLLFPPPGGKKKGLWPGWNDDGEKRQANQTVKAEAQSPLHTECYSQQASGMNLSVYIP